MNTSSQKHCRGPKRSIIKASLFLPHTPSEVTSSEAFTKSKRAVLTEERLKLETLVEKLSEEVKRKEQEACNLRKIMVPLKLNKNVCLNEQFKQGIEKPAAAFFLGKHNITKATILMDVIKDHMLFNGEPVMSLRQHGAQHIKTLFHLWRLVKAGNTSPVGAFKISTIEAFHKVIDEHDEKLFPSLKAAGES